NLLSTNFALSDKAFLLTIEKIEEGKWGNNVLSSNDKLYLEHYDLIFENLWKKGIDINDRIKEIKKGNFANVDVIPNPKESIKVFKELFNGTKKEILIILSSANAFFRIDENTGFKEIEKLAHDGIKAKILIPLRIELQNKINLVIDKHPNIEFRYLQNALETLIGITIIDREKVLILEIKDDSKRNYIDSIGLTIFIQGKSTALSYTSIFDSLWRQAQLYEQLKEAYEKIKIHDKMQKDFINVAAHELRTPIQPILGLSKIVKDKINDKEQKDLLEIVIKNTNRLKRLTEDILDVTRIESNKLQLNREPVYIWELLHSIIKEFGHTLENNKNIEFRLYFKDIDSDSVNVIADRNRLSQVISNLINNSIKFMCLENNKKDAKGLISIFVEKTKTYNSNKSKNSSEGVIFVDNGIIISIKDNGIGIDSEIFPRLFTKFVSKSFQGTGLGLYICKSIVEAHSGKIWAKNNEDRKGATFGFSLPFDKK
ncbi:MAG: sensor histidine kinase, partial [Candidatus Nitrosocosmicus sp.]